MLKANHSTKISEKVSFDGDNIIIKKTFDGSHMLKDAAQARAVTQNSFGSDYKHVGNVDMGMLAVWLKEAGIDWSDTQAVKDVLKRKLMSNEFSALRVWEGSY
tara:strand:+ start:1852 stop:2160 length:309 start_codon:yes stop_codon:yes gene_type:complete